MKKSRFVDIIIVLELVYLLLFEAFSDTIDRLPILLVYSMMALSLCGIVFAWYKYQRKEYSNKGLLFVITIFVIFFSVLFFIRG